MSQAIELKVSEQVDDPKRLWRRSTKAIAPGVPMLILIAQGSTSTKALAHHSEYQSNASATAKTPILKAEPRPCLAKGGAHSIDAAKEQINKDTAFRCSGSRDKGLDQ